MLSGKRYSSWNETLGVENVAELSSVPKRRNIYTDLGVARLLNVGERRSNINICSRTLCLKPLGTDLGFPGFLGPVKALNTCPETVTPMLA